MCSRASIIRYYSSHTSGPSCTCTCQVVWTDTHLHSLLISAHHCSATEPHVLLVPTSPQFAVVEPRQGSWLLYMCLRLSPNLAPEPELTLHCRQSATDDPLSWSQHCFAVELSASRCSAAALILAAVPSFCATTDFATISASLQTSLRCTNQRYSTVRTLLLR